MLELEARPQFHSQFRGLRRVISFDFLVDVIDIIAVASDEFWKIESNLLRVYTGKALITRWILNVVRRRYSTLEASGESPFATQK
jgi:hypothetical protein